MSDKECPECKGMDHTRIEDCPRLTTREKMIWMKGEICGMKYRDAEYKAMDRHTEESIAEDATIRATEAERKRIVYELTEWGANNLNIQDFTLLNRFIADRLEGK